MQLSCLNRIYTYFRYLSLDIVLGAVFLLMALENHYHLHFSTHIYFALASAVWIIYIIDHLLDVQNEVTTERREFHKTHFRSLIFIAGVVLVLALVNICFLPVAVIKYGALLSALCVGYLMLVYFVRGLWVKEILVAFGYAGGIFLAPFAFINALSLTDGIIFIQIVLVALINLCVFSYYDREKDQLEGFGSIVTSLGSTKTHWFIQLLLIASAGLALFVMVLLPSIATVSSVFLVMSLVLGVLFWFPKVFTPNERFRLIGDGVFYLPLLLLI